MVSSLFYVLIVTPVLFYWIHERRLRLEASPAIARAPANRRWATVTVVALIGLAAAGWFLRDRFTAAPRAEAAGAVLQTVRSGDLVITLANPGGELRQGANAFRIEFRSARTSALVDVGAVRLNATMTMPGMAMSGTISIAPAGQPGVFEATADLGMAGAWQMVLEWDGPAGRGSAAFTGSVQ
jgi:hypothetical protein